MDIDFQLKIIGQTTKHGPNYDDNYIKISINPIKIPKKKDYKFIMDKIIDEISKNSSEIFRGNEFTTDELEDKNKQVPFEKGMYICSLIFYKKDWKIDYIIEKNFFEDDIEELESIGSDRENVDSNFKTVKSVESIEELNENHKDPEEPVKEEPVKNTEESVKEEHIKKQDQEHIKEEHTERLSEPKNKKAITKLKEQLENAILDSNINEAEKINTLLNSLMKLNLT